MKKYWMIPVAAALAVTFTACGAGSVSDVSSALSKTASSQTASSETASSAIQVQQSSVPDTLAGLQKYLAGNAGVSGTAETMRSDMIGAKAGVRYKYDHNGKNNVTLELYEFDPNSLNAAAQKVLSDVKSTGKFTVIGQQVDGVLSQNGKYLMIYKNTASDDANKAYDKQLKDLFTEFKAE